MKKEELDRVIRTVKSLELHSLKGVIMYGSWGR